ncbi:MULTISPECIES: hypothetical protein [Sphingobacterium]|uniref:hypothetical protein n=1 Tax=Sphingobacterium TaxID=28453 RepID=UPI00257B8130|nr:MULTISPECIES: hypothetical protein [Sphingobacterium]
MLNQNFSIESVLFGIENIKGPIQLVQFANRLASHEGIRSFNRMAVIKLSNLKINKALPNSVPTDETLIIANEIGPYLDIYLCIRSGKSCCRIATAHFPGGEVYIHDEYRHTILLDKLSDEEIKCPFNIVCDDPSIIQPKPIFTEL